MTVPLLRAPPPVRAREGAHSETAPLDRRGSSSLGPRDGEDGVAEPVLAETTLVFPVDGFVEDIGVTPLSSGLAASKPMKMVRDVVALLRDRRNGGEARATHDFFERAVRVVEVVRSLPVEP